MIKFMTFSLPGHRSQSGQIVLIVLLLLMVGMTVGISILLDTMAETSITSTEERSEDTFNAAEAAIEITLLQDYETIADGADGVENIGGIDVAVDLVEINNIVAEGVPQNSTIAVNTTGAGTGQLLIRWTNPDSVTQHPKNGGSTRCDDGDMLAPASLLVERWYNVGTVPTVARYIYNANPCGSLVSGSATLASGNSSDTNYLSQVTTAWSIGPNDQVVRIRPLFNSADIYVEGAGGFNLPPQRLQITATPQDTTEARAIEVERYFGTLPDIFDYVLFSGTKVIKNN